MSEWTLREMLRAVGWTVAEYAKTTGQPECTARGQVYEGRTPEYPKPSRIKSKLAAANRAAGSPIPVEAIRALWMLRRRRAA